MITQCGNFQKYLPASDKPDFESTTENFYTTFACGFHVACLFNSLREMEGHGSGIRVLKRSIAGCLYIEGDFLGLRLRKF